MPPAASIRSPPDCQRAAPQQWVSFLLRHAREACPRGIGEAGIHSLIKANAVERAFDWIPASAGMTDFSASDGKLAHYPNRLSDRTIC